MTFNFYYFRLSGRAIIYNWSNYMLRFNISSGYVATLCNLERIFRRPEYPLPNIPTTPPLSLRYANKYTSHSHKQTTTHP